MASTYSTIAKWQEELGKSLTGGGYANMLSMISEGFAGEDTFAAITKDWQENYALPVMQMWQETIAPTIKEGYNLPGAFYSTSKSLGLQRAGEEFFSGQVTPTLFSALESARDRDVQLKSIYASLFGSAAGLATAGTQQLEPQGPSWAETFGQFGAGMSGIGSFLFGGKGG
jgi:hypothetical protein